MQITLRKAVVASVLRSAVSLAVLPVVLLAVFLSVPLCLARTPAPEAAYAYFIWPADGMVIQGGRLWVRMGLRDMGVAPKGVSMPNVGHHHLLIDTVLPQLDEQIPSDRNHLHFGAGETEARIELSPGPHTLQMLLGDQDHLPHEPPIYSKRIRIIVR